MANTIVRVNKDDLPIIIEDVRFASETQADGSFGSMCSGGLTWNNWSGKTTGGITYHHGYSGGSDGLGGHTVPIGTPLSNGIILSNIDLSPYDSGANFQGVCDEERDWPTLPAGLIDTTGDIYLPASLTKDKYGVYVVFPATTPNGIWTTVYAGVTIYIAAECPEPTFQVYLRS